MDKKERKTARLFAPTCLDLKEESEKKTKTHRRLGRLEKGDKKREREEEEERKRKRADMCAAPKGTSAFEAEALEQAVASTS